VRSPKSVVPQESQKSVMPQVMRMPPGWFQLDERVQMNEFLDSVSKDRDFLFEMDGELDKTSHQQYHTSSIPIAAVTPHTLEQYFDSDAEFPPELCRRPPKRQAKDDPIVS
jgi:hypothetical protein